MIGAKREWLYSLCIQYTNQIITNIEFTIRKIQSMIEKRIHLGKTKKPLIQERENKLY